MQVIAIDEITLNWSDLELGNFANHPIPEIVRDPGAHVSSLIKTVALAKKYYTPEDINDELPLRILLGIGWEWAAARLYKEMQWQPGQFEWDGVTGSPDGFSVESIPFPPPTRGSKLVNVIDEFKFSAKSLREKGKGPDDYKDITREWLWMAQLKSYLKIMSELTGDPWRYGRMHICWSMGNYTYPMRPRYFRYLIEFSTKEINDHWSYLRHVG